MNERRRRFGAVPEVVLVVFLSAVAFVLTRPTGTPAAAGTGPETQPTEERPGASDSTGAYLYGRDCAWCHGPEGEGSSRGNSLVDSGEAGAHYMLVTGRMPISRPDDRVRRSEPRYTDDQIGALVDHVAGFGDGPELPAIDPSGADVPRGGELYRLYCGMCHSATGIGGALASGQFAPSLMESEPAVIAAAVTTGPGAMPSFTDFDFDDEDLAAVAAYIDVLQDPRDEGGWPILRAGRADEAMVAWMVAVPALLLTAAWVARRLR